jgi:hypothetical protein
MDIINIYYQLESDGVAHEILIDLCLEQNFAISYLDYYQYLPWPLTGRGSTINERYGSCPDRSYMRYVAGSTFGGVRCGFTLRY